MKVFYSEAMCAENATAFSPSAGKPMKTVEQWKSLGMDIEIVAPTALTAEALAVAHDRAMVDGILKCEQDNGFDNRDPEVARSLPYVCGAMLDAARAALGDGIACAPISGAHHAGYDFACGFCTFNFLMVAAIKMHEDGVTRVGILDLDEHYGNGTDHIIRTLEIDYVDHHTQGKYSRVDAGVWLDGLADLIRNQYANCGLLLYQAGADPHKLDPLGGWLSTEEMRRRDQIVFETCKEMGLPVAYVHAGGYQTPIENVLELHLNTLKEALKLYGRGSWLGPS